MRALAITTAARKRSPKSARVSKFESRHTSDGQTISVGTWWTGRRTTSACSGAGSISPSEEGAAVSRPPTGAATSFLVLGTGRDKLVPPRFSHAPAHDHDRF